MPQSNVIFAFVFAAYVIFITMRGELPKYMGFLLATPQQAPGGGGSGGGLDPAKLANIAAMFAG